MDNIQRLEQGRRLRIQLVVSAIFLIVMIALGVTGDDALPWVAACLLVVSGGLSLWRLRRISDATRRGA